MVSKFKIERVLRGLTQQELGDEVDLSQTYINQIELLKLEKVGADAGAKLSKFFGKDIDDLLELV